MLYLKNIGLQEVNLDSIFSAWVFEKSLKT